MSDTSCGWAWVLLILDLEILILVLFVRHLRKQVERW